MSKRKKIAMWILIGFALLFVAAVILINRVSFSMSPEKVAAFFAGKPDQPTYRDYRWEDRNMRYIAVGDPNKPPVVFIHGSPGSWDAFIDFMDDADLLARARLISVDRPGFGHSGRGKPVPSLARQAAAIAPALRDNPSGRPPILVGHSLGGPLIARVAMDYPELAGALIFVAPSVDPGLEKIRWFHIVADWLVVSWVLPQDFITSNREILPHRPELEAMLPFWREIRAPATVIHGAKDRLVPPGNVDFLKEQLVNAPLNTLLVPDMNHFVPWTHPHLIKRAILRHLDQAESGGP